MKKEAFYQKFLEYHLCGGHCRLKNGETDVTTDTIHAEIKAWSQWKAAFGQLCYYNHVLPKPDLRLYLYGKKSKTVDIQSIVDFIKKYNIIMYQLDYNDNIITITNQIDKSVEYVPWIYHNTHSQNILSEETKTEIQRLLHNPNTIQTDFVVNLDKAANWLQVPKFRLLATLRDTYKVDIDYTIQKSSNKNGVFGSNNYKKVMLTPDCFKRLCMRSRSKRAEEVRTYFIQLESLLVRYKSVLLKGMEAEMKEMEKSLKPKDPKDKAGYIYVIKVRSDRDSVYKIGRTQNLTKRLSTYSTGTLDGVDVIFKYRTDSFKKTEACIKLLLKERQLRKYKEVYQVDIEMIKNIIHKCDDVVNYTRLYSNAPADRKLNGGYYIVLESDS